jgi:hypothetical protein
LLLLLAHGRLIVGHTPLARTLPTMELAAAEGTTQIRAAEVPRMGKKANPAANAGNDDRLQFRSRLQRRVQRGQILLNQRLGAIVLMPIRPKGEELSDGDNKKAKLSATILIGLCTPSSYLTKANASRGRARFFCALGGATADSPNHPPTPYHPPDPSASPAASRPFTQDIKRLLGRRNPFFFPSSGTLLPSRGGAVQLIAKALDTRRPNADRSKPGSASL